MALLCRSKQLNPLQRRFVAMCSITLILTAAFFACADIVRENHASPALVRTFTILPIFPFLAMMLLVPRYFAREKDEFVKTLVVRALLWAFALPMIVDTIWGFVFPLQPVVSMLNVDLFCITAMFAVALQVRRYQ